MPNITDRIRSFAWVILLLCAMVLFHQPTHAAQDSGSTGLEGRISAPAPATPATISFPRPGTTVTESTITVTGICPSGTIVKIFKNNVFAGSTQCIKGSFSLKIDLFTGQNDLVARIYDDLDQAGPDSSLVTVNYSPTNASIGTRVLLTSNFAKRGANPGETLVWPLAISGGDGPYAISTDWGDGSAPTIMSLQFAGNFNISHVYAQPGVYTVIVRAVDKNGNVAFLQLVGVANGALGQDSAKGALNQDKKTTTTKIIWWPLLAIIPLIILAFWLGKRHQLFVLKKKINEL